MKLAALFSDHAVLQRGIGIPVWGWTRPRTRVRATLGSVAAAETQSGADGRFLLRLPPLPAGGPYRLEVVAPVASERVAVEDVWVGEVWLASGQSNMEMSLSSTGYVEPEPACPGLRMITVPRLAMAGRQSDVTAAWQVASEETIGGFSAAAYHFARRLHRELGVTVGILHTSWGGTRVEAWTSRETLVQHPRTRDEVARYEATTFAPSWWKPFGDRDPSDASQGAGLDAAAFPDDPGNRGELDGWARTDFDDAAWKLRPVPSRWQDFGENYSGVFWYRRSVTVPATWAGRDLVLEIGAVDKHDITYFNGVRVGATGTGKEQNHWNALRSYRVPGKLVTAGRVTVAVRAYSFVFHGGMIGPAQGMRLRPAAGGESLPLAGEWRVRCEHNLGLVVPPAAVLGPGNPNSPGILFDNMVAPLAPYALRGAVWYQGESNAGSEAGDYGRQLTDMIADWRHTWGQGNFAFVTVQLANFGAAAPHQPHSAWALVREGQSATLADPAAGLAVAVDIGDAIDIHPRNKRDVGLRLAQWALARTYGRPIVPSGPLFDRMVLEGDRIRICFRHVVGGLVARGGALAAFVIAGSDRVFAPAEAAIEGDTVIVRAPAVREPVAVRYAWADNPEGCNLFNAEGLPASPFRTDVW